MLKEQDGIVIALDDKTAKVKASRHSDCENCGNCPGANAIIIEALNPVHASPGQAVKFQIKEVNMLQAAFNVYILPLIAAFIGVIAGRWVALYLGQPVLYWEIGGVVLAIAVSLVYIKHFDRSAKRNMLPVITQILS